MLGLEKGQQAQVRVVARWKGKNCHEDGANAGAESWRKQIDCWRCSELVGQSPKHLVWVRVLFLLMWFCMLAWDFVSCFESFSC